MMLTGAAALRSRLPRKAVFSQTRYGQPESVISRGIIHQPPRLCAHAAPRADRLNLQPNPYLTVSHYPAREPLAQKPSVRDLDVADSTPSLTHVFARSYSEVVFGQFRETKKMSQQARLEWPVAMNGH